LKWARRLRRAGYPPRDCASWGWIQARAVPATDSSSATAEAALAERLRIIFEAVHALIEAHRPDEIAVERVFVSRNADSALKLGQARGAALSAVPRGTPVFEYAPRAIKLSVVGYGAAEKQQVAHMMRTVLQLTGEIATDATDALAVALCHAHSRRLHVLVQAQRGARASGADGEGG